MPALIPWQPMKELQALRQQMDHLLDSWIQGEAWSGMRSQMGDAAWMPAIELQETDTQIILKAEIPGIPAEELTVEVSEKSVTITGEHQEENHTEEKGLYRSELHYGKFYRQVSLPSAVQNEAVQAQFKHGLLVLTLPKVEHSPPKVVKVSLTDPIREAVTESRQQQELRQEQVESRAEAALKQPNGSQIAAETRATVTQGRQKAEHLQETIHRRAVDEIGAPS